MDETSRGKIEFAEEVAESLSDQGDLESVERRDARGVQKVDVEYEGDTYRIRTYAKDLEEDAPKNTPSRATINLVDGDEEVKVAEASGVYAEELADEVYAELAGEGGQPLENHLDSDLEDTDQFHNKLKTPNYHDRWELDDGREVGRIGGPQYILDDDGQIASPPLHGVEAIDDGVYAVVYRNIRGGDETGLMREENLDENIHERMEKFRERDTEILDRPGDNRASEARIANRKAKVRATRDIINTTPGAITAARVKALFGGLFE